MSDNQYVNLIKKDREETRRQLDEAISLLARAQCFSEDPEKQAEWQELRAELWEDYTRSLQRR